MDDRILRRRERRVIRRRRTRRSVAVLPTLFTLGNLLCGFAALHYAANGNVPENVSSLPVNAYAVAGYLIFGAMLFDMLDGRMARLARSTSDFGGELDSLADVVSFGAAPAFLTLQLISSLLFKPGSAPGQDLLGPLAATLVGRLFWIIGAVYVSCTALRLARFNIHNRHAEDSHMVFRGLPSPGAAGVVASSVIFFETIQPATAHVLPFNLPTRLTGAINFIFPYAMPGILLIMAILMVSRVVYPHLINQYLRGRKSFTYVARLAVLLILLLAEPQFTALLVIYVYAFAAPVSSAWRKLLKKPPPPHVLAATAQMPKPQISTAVPEMPATAETPVPPPSQA